MKKSTFVPSPDALESRIALSSGPKFVHGVPILTRQALGQTYSLVQRAFNQFSHDGQNYYRLRVDLANAVNRIPWNRRDGLLATVQGEATNLRLAIAPGAYKPVLSQMQSTLQDVKEFVQSEVASGVIIVR
jgi:hypothetical protein